MNTYLVTIPVETLYMMLDYLSIENIVNVCNSNLELSFICQDDRFWADKAYHDFNFPKEIFDKIEGSPIERYSEIEYYKKKPIKSFIDMLSSNQEIDLDVINAILPYLTEAFNKKKNQRGEVNVIIELIIEKGSIPLLKLFMENFNKFPETDPGYILSRAATYGRINIGGYILENYGDRLYEQNNKFLWGPIRYASWNNNEKFITLLINYAEKHKISIH